MSREHIGLYPNSITLIEASDERADRKAFQAMILRLLSAIILSQWVIVGLLAFR